MEEKFGWSIGAITLGFTIQWLLSATLSPICGWLSDRYGVRRVMWGGGLMFMLGMIMTGFMSGLWEYYLYFGLVLAVGTASFQVTLVSGVTLWFRRRLGLAMGILQALQGLGTGLAILMVYLLYDRYGWEITFLIPGIAGGIILLALTNWFYNEPADRGITQWGAPEGEPVRRLQNNAVAKLRTGVFLKQVQKTATFWNLATIHGLGCAGHNVILILLVAIAENSGIQPALAATVYLTLTLVSAATRFATPVLADLIGSKWVMGVCFALQTFPILILFGAGDSVGLYFLFAVLFGIGMGGEMSAFPIINRQYYADAPTGHGLRMADDGGRPRHGSRPGVGRVPARRHRRILLAPLAVLRPQHLSRSLPFCSCPTPSGSSCPDWEEALPPDARGNVSRSAGTPASGAAQPAPQPAQVAGATGDGDGD